MTDLSKVTFRTTTADDIPALKALHAAAFKGNTEAELVEKVVQSGTDRLSMVAELEGAIVGHVLFTPVEIEREEVGKVEGALGLGPMAVHPDHQRKRVGFELLWAALSELGHQETPAVFVLGWPDFYQKFGFKPAFEWGLRWEHPADREVFMGLEMEKDFLSGPLGVVRYLPEFSAP
ncbi:MAG TPA: N-acetyltransferase [Myxococcaceae bacterium]|nr:N-acetyltransferase [Myxococcaceae bacterium]